MLDCTAGEDAGAPLSCPPQERPYLDEVTREPGRLRIAVTTEPFFADTSRGNPVHADCRAALDDAAALLRTLGHDVEVATPTFDGPRLARAFLTVVAAECRADIMWLGEQLKRAPRSDDVEVATWALGLVGASYSAADYADSVRLLQLAGRTVGQFFTRYDVLVTPTLGAPPFPIGQLQPSAAERAVLALFGRLRLGGVLRAAGLLDETARKVFGFIPYTPLFNVTGQPAMSVPLYWNAHGLPIGTHYVSRLGDEATLFRLAGQLERARPWSSRAPRL
jgi:amidase